MILFSVLQNASVIERIVGNLRGTTASIVTDSRQIKDYDPNSSVETFFIPLVGERFNGHQFIEDFLAKGHRCFAVAVTEQAQLATWQAKYPDLAAVVVTDTLKFLQELAALRVQDWRKKNPAGQIMGITGSNGKTTHKEMLAYLIEGILPGKVHTSKGNLNNHIGVPLTLLGIEDQHQVIIVEMGINHPGEMLPLCQMADPESALITNIGSTHLEFLGSEAGVWQEKKNLFLYCQQRAAKKPRPGAFLLMGGAAHWMQDLPASPLKTMIVQERSPLDNGTSAAEYCLTVLGHGGELQTPDGHIYWQNKNIVGQHNQANLGRALLAAISLRGWSAQAALEEQAAGFKASFNRSSWVRQGDLAFYLDAYNANPSSMAAALRSFVQQMAEDGINLGQCCFVLGDMNELGPQAPELHRQIGRLLGELHALEAIFVGRYAEYYAEGFPGRSTQYVDREALKAAWPLWQKRFSYFFIKASRSLQLEAITAITS